MSSAYVTHHVHVHTRAMHALFCRLQQFAALEREASQPVERVGIVGMDGECAAEGGGGHAEPHVGGAWRGVAESRHQAEAESG